MYNMSYCRFENTVRAMWECVDALRDAGWNMDTLKESKPSDYEEDAMESFVTLCRKVARQMQDERTE